MTRLIARVLLGAAIHCKAASGRRCYCSTCRRQRWAGLQREIWAIRHGGTWESRSRANAKAANRVLYRTRGKYGLQTHQRRHSGLRNERTRKGRWSKRNSRGQSRFFSGRVGYRGYNQASFDPAKWTRYHSREFGRRVGQTFAPYRPQSGWRGAVSDWSAQRTGADIGDALHHVGEGKWSDAAGLAARGAVSSGIPWFASKLAEFGQNAYQAAIPIATAALSGVAGVSQNFARADAW
jgi:hypothetical protein